MQSRFSKYSIWMASSEGTMTINVLFKELILSYSTENNFCEEKNCLTENKNWLTFCGPPSPSLLSLYSPLLPCNPYHIITSRMMMMMTTFRQDDNHRQNLTNTLLQDHSSRDCDTANF